MDSDSKENKRILETERLYMREMNQGDFGALSKMLHCETE